MHGEGEEIDDFQEMEKQASEQEECNKADLWKTTLEILKWRQLGWIRFLVHFKCEMLEEQYEFGMRYDRLKILKIYICW